MRSCTSVNLLDHNSIIYCFQISFFLISIWQELCPSFYQFFKPPYFCWIGEMFFFFFFDLFAE